MNPYAEIVKRQCLAEAYLKQKISSFEHRENMASYRTQFISLNSLLYKILPAIDLIRELEVEIQSQFIINACIAEGVDEDIDCSQYHERVNKDIEIVNEILSKIKTNQASA